MEFPEYLDTRDLVKLCDEAAEILENSEDYDAEDIADAHQTLSTMKAALAGMNLYGMDSMENEDLSGNWKYIEDNYHCTLVRLDAIEEYVEEKTVEYGLLTKESLEHFTGFIDWSKYADRQNHLEVVFPNLDAVDAHVTYWIFD